jgi:hypothetical protein
MTTWAAVRDQLRRESVIGRTRGCNPAARGHDVMIAATCSGSPSTPATPTTSREPTGRPSSPSKYRPCPGRQPLSGAALDLALRHPPCQAGECPPPSAQPTGSGNPKVCAAPGNVTPARRSFTVTCGSVPCSLPELAGIERNDAKALQRPGRRWPDNLCPLDPAEPRQAGSHRPEIAPAEPREPRRLSVTDVGTVKMTPARVNATPFPVTHPRRTRPVQRAGQLPPARQMLRGY